MSIANSLQQEKFQTRWRTLQRCQHTGAPAPWNRWLADRGSLTRHLITASQGNFCVRLLKQGWGYPTRSEALLLKIPPRQWAVIREVELQGNGQPWVYARSVIPAATLTGRERQLHGVGSRSLGSVLFRNPTMRRGPMQITHLSSGKQRFYARRSLFLLSNKPLLVCEVFLPSLSQVNYQP